MTFDFLLSLAIAFFGTAIIAICCL